MPAIRLAFLLVLTGALGGCAVVAVGSAVTSVASFGVKTATTAGGLVVDGAAAAGRAGASALGGSASQTTTDGAADPLPEKRAPNPEE